MCSVGKVILTLGIIGLLLLTAGLLIGFSTILDNYIDEQIKDNIKLANGTEQYERWEKLPVPLQFKIYAFNVVNPEKILEGEKPIVEQIGPWVYNEYKEKEDIVYNEEEDTLTYKQRTWFEFDRDLSAFNEDKDITVLNMPLQGIFLTIEDTAFVESMNQFWDRMFQHDGYFLTLPAKQLFFEGYDFCIKENLTGYTGIYCGAMKSLMSEIVPITTYEDKISFALFAHKQNTTDGEYTISAGNKDINTIGEILSWEGLEYLDKWGQENSSCNHIRGRDSTIYPPYNNQDSSFDVFSTDVCRIMNLQTTDETEFQDIKGIVATLSADEMKNDGSGDCYCIKKIRDLNGDFECLPAGFGDMSTCLGAPTLISLPHMLGANEIYSSTIKGLTPRNEEHKTFVTIEPGTGTPLQGAKRMQFNMIIRPITGLDVTQNLQHAVFPVVWVEESFSLPEDLVQILKDNYFSKLSMLNAVTWTLIGIGAGLSVVCLIYFAIKFIS